MKITAISDLHGHLPEIKDTELLLICGDIMPLSIQRNIPKSEEWLRTVFAYWINNIPCNDVVLVGGNHDFALVGMYDNEFKKAEILSRPTNFKLHLLENSTLIYPSIDGNTYTIWGTPYCKQFGNWAFMYDEETLKQKYSKMPKDCDIVISHDAPKLMNLGLIDSGPYAGTNAGNPYLTNEIIKKAPKYFFCGHIHSGEHGMQRWDNIIVSNVSLVDEHYDVTNKPLNIEILSKLNNELKYDVNIHFKNVNFINFEDLKDFIGLGIYSKNELYSDEYYVDNGTWYFTDKQIDDFFNRCKKYNDEKN